MEYGNNHLQKRHVRHCSPCKSRISMSLLCDLCYWFSNSETLGRFGHSQRPLLKRHTIEFEVSGRMLESLGDSSASLTVSLSRTYVCHGTVMCRTCDKVQQLIKNTEPLHKWVVGCVPRNHGKQRTQETRKQQDRRIAK